jgi:hypothetical protein
VVKLVGQVSRTFYSASARGGIMIDAMLGKERQWQSGHRLHGA